MNAHSLIWCNVFHHRHIPIDYRFSFNFFWFKINLLELEALGDNPLISINRFNFYSFYHTDHIKYQSKDTINSYTNFLKDNGVTEDLKELTLYTHLRFIGYVFNPVSFIFATTLTNKRYGIIEIGNTFNELKPYFIPSHCFNENQATINTKKLFYISPFIDLDSEMTFNFSFKKDFLSIRIKDKKDDQLILDTVMSGRQKELTTLSVIAMTLRYPFITLRVILAIHWHALILWLKKVPYIKKSKNPELQKGVMVWKE